jgi:uncharacterized protein YbaP (TraB family)
MPLFARRLLPAIAIAVLSVAGPARAAEPAPPPCAGVDRIAKAKAETPEKYAAFEAEARAVPNAEGLLWRISGKGRPTSYLFGTMHTTEADLVSLSEPVRAALSEVKTVAVELADANGAASQAEMVAYVTRNGIDMSGKGLEGLTPEQVAEVKRRLADAGIPASVAAVVKPWFLGMTLQLSACQLRQVKAGLPTIDAAIEKAGKDAGATVVGLETVTEQLKAVSAVSDDTARRMIRDAVAEPGSSNDLQTTTLKLYRERRVGWYLAMKGDTFGKDLDVSAYADFLEGIVDRRNHLMAERAEPLLAAGPTMIAVGALHLPGPNGLVELLRKDGYAVDKVW